MLTAKKLNGEFFVTFQQSIRMNMETILDITFEVLEVSRDGNSESFHTENL